VDGILDHNLLLSRAFFSGNPFVDGILGHNLLLSRGPFGGNPFVDGILGFHRAFFHNLFFFSQWNSGYQGAFLMNFSFFSRWNFGYQEAFHTNFYFFSQWNSGYQEAFHMNFSFFTMKFWLSGSLSHELFFFHDGILAIRKPFTRTFRFSRWNSRNTQFGGRLFSYIYHKEFLHRICLVKNLSS
jgi:hypothetical protein